MLTRRQVLFFQRYKAESGNVNCAMEKMCAIEGLALGTQAVSMGHLVLMHMAYQQLSCCKLMEHK